MEDSVRWTPEVGRRLKKARGAMSVREAARRAQFSESTWRALELGVRRPAKGVVVPVNPTFGVLVHAAEAVDEDVDEILALAGIRAPRSETTAAVGDEAEPAPAQPTDPTDLVRRLNAVEATLLRQAEQLEAIERHLGIEEHP